MIPQAAMISTYPPTRCGVATYSRSLAAAMSRLGQEVRVLRLNDSDRPSKGPAILGDHRGRQDIRASLAQLNSQDVVILQHDFDLFDGDDGDEILDLIVGLRVPLITVLHSVTGIPTNRQRRVIQGLLDTSDAVVVLSAAARQILIKTYDVCADRLFFIPNGAPDIPASYRSESLRMRPRMLSWGLLRPGKGLEWGIAALYNLRDMEPMPDYYIVGQTHPREVQRDGLAYRRQLEKLAHDMDVADRVHFIDDYLDASTLINTIASADFYLLPFDTVDQSSSAILAEAMAAGGPVISTRFPHAVELLGDGTGYLVNQGDPQSIATAVRNVVRDVDGRERMRRHSRHKAQDHLWPAVGAKFVSLVHQVMADHRTYPSRVAAASVPA